MSACFFMGHSGRELSLATSIRVLLAALLMTLASLACAQDLIVERAWVEEVPGKPLSLQQVQAQGGTHFEGTLSRGYGAGAVWLRLRIDPRVQAPAEGEPDGLVLRMRPPYLDDIQVFDPLATGGLAGRVGDRHPPALDALPGQDFLLPIARGTAPRDIWLRLESSSTRQIHVQALGARELNASLPLQALVCGLYVGLLAMLVAWGLIRWVLTREVLMGAFVCKELSALLFALSSLGFLRVFWPAARDAAMLDVLGSVFSILGVSGAALFHLVFLREFQPPRWGFMMLAGATATAPVLLLLLALGYPQQALTGNMLIVMLTPWLMLANVVLARGWASPNPAHRPLLPRGLVVGVYTLFVLLLGVGASTALALAPASWWTIYIVQMHGLISGCLLLLLLQYRSRRRYRLRQQALMELERSRIQAEHDRRLHEEQKQLLVMLAHEIKTPLATMHMRLDAQAAGGEAIRHAMRDMTAVIDRCMQTALLGDGEMPAQIEQQDAAIIVRDAIAACSDPARVKADLPRQLSMRTDQQLLFIVVGNLLENACKYSPEGTSIELSVQACEDDAFGPALRLDIRNRPGSSGWPDPERLFEKFYRSPQAQRRAGTGLGLYLVDVLTAKLGGRIAYQPADGWIRFVLVLPLAGVTAAPA